jgi:hypothetical protein
LNADIAALRPSLVVDVSNAFFKALEAVAIASR